MYLDTIALIRTLPCLAEPGKIIVVGQPSRSLDEVLPYLATLPGVIAYNPEGRTLTFRRQPGIISLQRHEVCITQVSNLDEGLGLLVALTDSINAVWEQRDQLVAVEISKQSPRPLDIWKLLPKTNCRECGEPTCMAFATSLLQEKRSLAECPILQSDPHATERLAALTAMF